MKFDFYYPRASVGNGGVTNSLWSWVEALEAAGHEIKVLSHARLGNGRQDSRIHPVPHIEAGSLRIPKLDLGQSEADVLILSSGWTPENWFAAAQARSQRVPYVVVPHGAYEPGLLRRRRLARRVARIMESRMLAEASFVHIFFDSEIRIVKAIERKARCVVSPTGMSTQKPTWKGGGKYLIWLGRYDVEHKGLDLLIQSVALIQPQQRPRIRLYGRDSRDTRDRVRAMVERANLSTWISVHGPVAGEEKDTLLDHADGYVHPSRWECHSMALAECLRRGMPALVSSTTNIAPDLESYGAALVAEPGTSRFGRQLGQLPRKGHALSHAAQFFVDSELNWHRSIKLVEDAL